MSRVVRRARGEGPPIHSIVLLRCEDNKKTRMALRDALVDLDDVMEAFLTDEKILDVQYRVGGSIVSTEAGLSRLYAKLHKLRNGRGEHIPVSEVAVLRGMHPGAQLAAAPRVIKRR